MHSLIICIVCLWLVNVILARESIDWHEIGADYRDVNTTEGIVRGFFVNDDNYVYLAFLGVPYAAPPIRNMRFKQALPLGPWNGVLSANRTVKCPQNGEGDENCLFLNIFTPAKVLNGPLPVLCIIQGDFFITGVAPTTGFKALLSQNIIVVTINYRLGALGFLCLGVKEAPGNVGMKDQVVALKWLNRNIGQFGGDPNRVTLYGINAGGASVEYHVISPLSKGYFQQVIVESGAATSVSAMDTIPLVTAMNAIRFDVATCCKYSSGRVVRKLFDSCMKLPASNISAQNMRYHKTLTDGTVGFAPCVETVIPGRQTYMFSLPVSTLRKAKYKKVPMMFIYSKMEGLFLKSTEYYEQNYKERMNSNFLDFLPKDLIFDSDEIQKQVAENIRMFYFGNETIGDDLEQYLNYFGDYIIMRPMLNSVEIHSNENNPVYLMEFGYKGNLGSEDKFYDSIQLAGHGDAGKYVILEKPAQDLRDELTVARMTKLLGNFIKFTDPTPERTDLLPIYWPKVTPKNVSYLLLDDDMAVYEEPIWGRKKFWEVLYKRFGNTAKPTKTLPNDL